jgi:hypothetical protein
VYASSGEPAVPAHRGRTRGLTRARLPVIHHSAKFPHVAVILVQRRLLMLAPATL